MVLILKPPQFLEVVLCSKHLHSQCLFLVGRRACLLACCKRAEQYKSSLYNYTDDNTLSYAHSNSDTLIHTVQQECSSTLQWFNVNQMKANPSKFQATSFGKRGTRDITNILIF